MKKLSGYWIARLVLKTLIPVMFFVVANTERSDVANGLAGVMVIFTLAYYTMLWQHIGDTKYL